MLRQVAAWLVALCLLGIPGWASTAFGGGTKSCHRTKHCCCKKPGESGTGISAVKKCCGQCSLATTTPVIFAAEPEPVTALTLRGAVAPISGTSAAPDRTPDTRYQRPPPARA